MKSTRIGDFSLRTGGLFGAMLACITAVLMVACGGGGTTPVTGVSSLRALPAEFSSRKAVAYSPYRTATNVDGLAGETIPEANILQDLRLLQSAGFGLIRTFDSSDKVAKATLQVIFKYGLDIKMQLGAYMQNGDESFNRAELARAAALANQYFDIVLAVSVGNENMVSWSFNPISPAGIAGYINTLRPQIKQPVTSDDNWLLWANSPTVITDAIDFVSLHTYTELDTVFAPDTFDWKQLSASEATRATAMMNAAIAAAKQQYQAVRKHLDQRGLTTMPITIGETGWNAVNLGALAFRAHPVNQKMYLDLLAAWAAEGRAGKGPAAVFYFEAFDETWKQGDDGWGLFNKNRQARYAIQSLGTCGVTWTCEPGTYTASDALYFKLPVVNPAVTAARYTIYADAAAGPNEVKASGLRWDAFDGTTASYPEVGSTAAPTDPSRSIEISPTPASFGWGLLSQSPTGVSENLSQFSGGSLNFSINTTYAGKIEIGFGTDTQDRAGAEAYLQISPGQYGYCNNGSWCQVSIPLSAFLAVNPKLDLSVVLSRFIIADRFDKTGNFQKSGLPKIYLDAISWAK